MKPTVTQKYRPFPQVDLADRQWPTRVIDSAPIWCSVDLRDGNQSLINPMSVAEKLEFFELLKRIGFKEIEVGFPSAAEVEFSFVRRIIEEGLLPADVFPQVLTQARPHLIERTFEALEGAKQAIVHLYNSTSTLQRKVVFRMDQNEILEIATQGTALVRQLADKTETDIRFEYSPESFSGTELEFALEVCSAVIDIWGPTPDKPMIINLPATVELSTPNVHADQIEWMSRHLPRRESIILSLHTHNDRGTGVAATELGLLAGAERVEGTLFGNGERTGNVDIVTLALNMFTQGLDPKLDFQDLPSILAVAERCTRLPVHERHPYAGELVFTAFSGSHQDAINKGMAAQKAEQNPLWEIPYLPIDPTDIGRTYEAIIRINSQSGKGGVAYIMESDFGCLLPKAMHPEFSRSVQRLTEQKAREVRPEEIWELFEQDYLNANTPLELLAFGSSSENGDDLVRCRVKLRYKGKEMELEGQGNGPIDACRKAIADALDLPQFTLTSYSEHALEQTSESRAIAYIQLTTADGVQTWGAGIDKSITKTSIKALFSATNRILLP